MTAVAAKRAAEVLITSLQSIRNDKSFELFWSTTQSASHTVGVLPPELPRARKVPARFASGSENVTFAKPEDYFRSVYYNFIDCATGCVQDRFEQSSFAVYMNGEKILLDTFSGKTPDDSTADVQAVADHFDGDVDVKILTIQLSMLSSLSTEQWLCSEPGMTAPTPNKSRYLFAAIVGRRYLLLQPISCRERSFQPSARL